MSRPPSDATSLRKTRELLNTYKIRVTKLEQEVAQWKARFDALLMRTADKQTITEKSI